MLIFAFFSLGFLIGNLMGLSSAKSTELVIGLLFSFVGGSAIAFLNKIPKEEKIHALKAIVGLSWGCIFGVYVSVPIAEHQMLSPAWKKERSVVGATNTIAGRPSVEATKYLFTNKGKTFEQLVQEVDADVNADNVTPKDGLQKLLAIQHEWFLQQAESNSAAAYDRVYKQLRAFGAK